MRTRAFGAVCPHCNATYVTSVWPPARHCGGAVAYRRHDDGTYRDIRNDLPVGLVAVAS